MKLGVYRLLMAFLQGPLFVKLIWRSRQEPLYRQHLGERFGRYPSPKADTQHFAAKGPSGSPLVWLHAVSLGETHASAPLVLALRKAYPTMRLVLTHGTATGRAAGAALLQSGDCQAWAPWDTQAAVQGFLDHFKPDIGLLMETEVWPGWALACANQRIPLVLVNARLSERSLQRTLRWGLPLMRQAYEQLALLIPQTVADAQRFVQLGARLAPASGNLKFDTALNPTLRAQGVRWRAASGKPVVMLASSREGEEVLLLDALKAHPARKAVQWLIVPRHPQRFDEVAQLAQQKGFAVSRRSQWDAQTNTLPSADIWLGDSLGEMPAYYSLASCALMGGTYLPFGGQNLIEACHYGCPVMLGPSTFNFAEAATLALQCQAAQQVADMVDGVSAVGALLNTESGLNAMHKAALQFATLHSGATLRTIKALDTVWPAVTLKPIPPQRSN